MLTHTGRTYERGSVHPRRCERAGCEAPAIWYHDAGARGPWAFSERLCAHHAKARYPGSYYQARSARPA